MPRRPAGEPVDGVAGIGLGERQLVLDAGEAVAPVGDAVGPGQEGLAPGAGAHLLRGVAVEQFWAADGVAARTATHFGDAHGPGPPVQAELLPRGGAVRNMPPPLATTTLVSIQLYGDGARG